MDIVRTLNESMRSVASNWRQEFKRKAVIEAPLPVGRDADPTEFLENVLASGDSIQDRLEAEERKAAMTTQLDEINQIVAERETAALIIMAMSEGMDGQKTREELGLTVQQHETEMLWIRRKLRAKFKDGRVR